MSEVRITISAGSVQQVVSNLRRKAEGVRDAANAELEVLIQQLFAEAQQRVPTVTGALAASGHVAASNMDSVLERTIGYGTSLANPITGLPTSSYAVDRHERFNPAKPESYKWLETTMLNNTDACLQGIANAIARGLNS